MPKFSDSAKGQRAKALHEKKLAAEKKKKTTVKEQIKGQGFSSRKKMLEDFKKK